MNKIDINQLNKPAKIEEYSLRTRLLLWLLIPLILIGLAALYDGYRSARITSDEVSDRVLAGSALAIAERVFVNDEGQLEVDIPYVALQMLTSSEDDRVFYKIEHLDGRFITGYRGLKLPTTKQNSDDNLNFSNGDFRGSQIRLVTLGAAASSNTKSLSFKVAVAETTNARKAIAQDLLIGTAIRIASLISAAALIVWFAVTRALLPLQKLEEAVARRSPEDVRPIRHNVPVEVSGLVNTINGLVGRFASSISALQNFTSYTSHQFRTPLALIKTHLEIASRETSKANKQDAIANARYAVDDAERIMAQLLLLARLDAVSKNEIRTKTCDLSALSREVCEEFVLRMSQSAQKDMNIDIGFESEEAVFVYADETLVKEVVRNLVDNAIKHGGKSSKIDVIVAKQNLLGSICVQDHGAGFDPEKAFS
ncbi:MAG: sensor histidine kinase, partial [Nitratireductor sp.]